MIAAIIATGVNAEGKREILGLGLGPSEAAVFWLDFLRSLKKRGLKGVKLVISDAHEGLKAAIAHLFKASWQRCRVHFIRNALAHVPKAQHSMVSAAIRSVFAQDNQAAASQTWRHVSDQLRPRFAKLAGLMDEAEADVIAFMAFPRALAEVAFDKPHRASEQGGQTPRRCRRHLPQRGLDQAARRHGPARTKRRVAIATSLHEPGDHEWYRR